MFSKPKFKPQHDLLKPLTRVKDLPSDHVCRQFVEMRRIPKKFYNILYYTDDFHAYMKLVDPDVSSTKITMPEPRLVIPFFNKKDEVVAVQGRSLSMKDEYKRELLYGTLPSSQTSLSSVCGMVCGEPIQRSVCMLSRVRWTVCSLTIRLRWWVQHQWRMIPSRFANTDMVYVLDNEPRNQQIINFNKNLIDQGKTVCICFHGIRDKDINDMIYHMTPKQIKKIMDDNAVSGLEAMMRLNRWRKI